ncbi:MAG: aspartate aminotransferase [Flavobacteriales bacterium]|jgi:aspartate aminotransferase
MPILSHKADFMPASPIRKLVPFAEAAIKKGRTVYHLNIGQPDVKTPYVVLERLKSMTRDVIEYSNSEGYLSYREGLVGYYANNAVTLNVEDIMVTTGGSEALAFAFMSCFNPGDEVIIPEPFYANYNAFAVMAGIVVIPVTATIDDGFALPSIEEFKEKITPKTKGILICNPGNPTGYLYKKEELQSLKKLVTDNDLWLLADEVYREFCYDGASPFSVLNLKDIEQNVVLIDSVSKRYSMCGSRIGALISRNRELMASALKFAQARLSPPTMGQVAGEAALETPASYFTDVVEEYVSRRDIMVDGLNKIPGVICPKPSGAFYCMAQFPIDNADAFCQWMLESFEHKNQTVMMAPASGFYASPNTGLNQVRIAYVLNKEALKNAVECIEIALEQYPGRVESSS